MPLHEFTLHIEPAPDDAGWDRIYEAGLDDTAPEESPDGRAWLQVMRRADSMADAITSAVAQLQSAGYRAVGVDCDDFVTLTAIGQKTGRTRESVRLLATGKRGPGGFPSPVATGKHPLYSWSLVRDWFRAHFGDQSVAAGDDDADTLAAANLLLRARLIAPDLSRLAPLVAA